MSKWKTKHKSYEDIRNYVDTQIQIENLKSNLGKIFG